MIAQVLVDSTSFPQIYQRDEGAFLHMGVLLPGFASRETCQMAANCSQITLVGDISNLEAPYSPVGPDNSTSGPFGPFQREVQLTHPVDITVPVESRMGLGILEFRFQKGASPPACSPRATCARHSRQARATSTTGHVHGHDKLTHLNSCTPGGPGSSRQRPHRSAR